MAIPWLIGAAVVGLAAVIMSDDSSKQEEEELREREEKKRIASAAEAKRQQAREEAAREQEKVRQRQLNVFSHDKIQTLLTKHNIHNTSLNHVTHLAIHNTDACEDLLQKAYINSKTLTDIKNKVSAHEHTLKEIDKLLAQLTEIATV